MSVLSPNTRFILYGATFKVDFVADGKVRFHNVSDTYDVWELDEDWLLEKMQTGRLKVILDSKSTFKSALEIIQESLSPEAAAKFHSGSRKPFDYEAPVIEVAKQAMAGRTFKKVVDGNT